MASEQISCGGNHTDPNQRPQKIEDHEFLPGHSQNTCQRSSDDPHAEYEAGDKNSRRTVTREQLLASFQRRLSNTEKRLVARDERPSAVISEGEPQVVSNSGGDRGDDNDPRKPEFVLGVSQE